VRAYVTYDSLAGKPYAVSSSARGFSIGGTPTLLLGGSMHPPRMARADWAPLLRQARADGLNHVQIYTFWNYHELERGRVDFSPGTRRDLGGFFTEAAKAGLFVNVRIGPYVCAEWDGGGLPLWLANVANFTCSRCADPVWQEQMGGFVRAVAAVMRPFLARVGGPIVMAQIENELRLKPSDPYVAWCGELAASLDLDIPWVMCNGASASNTINACNGRHCSDPGQYADTHAALFPGQPLVWTEDWSFFATWGNAVADESGPAWASRIGNWFALGAAHHDYYMYYGGNHVENWGGASITNRYGDGSILHSDTLPNEPKHSHLAAMHRALAAMSDALMGAPIVPRSAATKVDGWKLFAFEYGAAAFLQNTAGRAINATFRGRAVSVPAFSTSFLLGNATLFNSATVDAAGIACNRTYTALAAPSSGALSGWESWAEPLPPAGGKFLGKATPPEQLSLTLDRSAYCFYAAELPATSEPVANLTLQTIESSAFVMFLDGAFVAAADEHTHGGNRVTVSLPVPPAAAAAAAAPRKLLLLSSSLGIQNFGSPVGSPGDVSDPLNFKKGILGDVLLVGADGKTLANMTAPAGGWVARPFLGGELANASSGDAAAVAWAPCAVSTPSAPLMWLRATFSDPRPAMPAGSVLLLDAKGLGRGHFYINGHDLGRYWPLVPGASRHYYVPLELIEEGSANNTLTVFDELGAPQLATVTLVFSQLELPARGAQCPE
jgi:hypothetical protein